MARRLLFVSHEMTLSGAPIQLAYLAQWLRARRWEITFVTPEPGDLAAKLDGIEIIYESQLLIDPTYGVLRRLAPQFDGVLANTIVTWEAVQACHLEGVPVVWYIHETALGRELMKVIHMIEPSLELANTVVTPTHTSARVYSGFRSKRIEVVPYGIPAVAPAPSQPSERTTFALIGTFEERKGQDVLLEAVARLEPRLGRRASFFFAGRVLHDSFHETLQEKAALLENVELIGALNHAAAMRLLARADVLVCPSRDETMPIVLLEAMSLSKPIVCTRVGGIEEWMRDGENGILVRPEDVGALSEAIARLIKSRWLRWKLGRRAQATFARNFTIDRYGEQFAELIEKTLARRPAVAR